MTELKDSLGSIAQVFDPYARRARLSPALFVIFPLALLIFVWLPGLHSLLGRLISFGVSFGALFWLAEIARDNGKKKEPDLYKLWGGKPSVELLRYSDKRIDPVTKARYRTFLSQQVSGLIFPTSEEEENDPLSTLAPCEAATTWLLSQTRDTKRFSLLFKELVSYGFRRNLWGLKRIGSTLTFIAGTISSSVLLFQYFKRGQLPEPELIIATGIIWVIFFIWVIWVNPEWVRIPADAYGKELLAACDILHAARSNK